MKDEIFMQTVIIIGAGPAGLASAKYALDNGFQPIVFEQAAFLGGLWHPESGGTWHSMQTNLSKFTCMFSDFNWSKDAPIFPNQREVYDYLCGYAEKFNLNQYIQFNTKVLKVTKEQDKWKIVVKEKGQAEKEFMADFVIVAAGAFSEPHIPNFKGLDNFKGMKLHSKYYKSAESFQNKTVVVIGSSFSGHEISADLATQTNVVNIIGRPSWILPRFIPSDPLKNILRFPVDLVFYNRASRKKNEEVKFKSLEDNQKSNGYMSVLCKEQGQFEALKISSSSNEPSRVAISDTYLEQVKQGNITVQKSKIAFFDGNSIILSNGENIIADAVIFCTGYKTNLTFLDTSILKTLKYEPEDQLQPLLLYKCTLHPELSNIAFVGMYRGPYFAVIELQAKWANSLFSGKAKANSKEVMEKEILEELAIRNQNPRPQFPHPDYVGLADSIAKEIGVLPDLDDLKKQNEKIHKKFISGPVLPSHYRLLSSDKGFNEASTQISEVDEFMNEASSRFYYKKAFHAVLGGLTIGLGLYFAYKRSSSKSTVSIDNSNDSNIFIKGGSK